jgi:hypoxanthine phosphoribosyltransferase
MYLQGIKKVLINQQTIFSRLDELGEQITRDYQNKDLTIISLLNGSIIFTADLLRRIQVPLKLDCWSISSYKGTTSSGEIKFRQQIITDVNNRHVLILDDILDSGLTLYTIKDQLLKQSSPLSVKTCVLLNKNAKREKDVDCDYYAFKIENEFVIGYGLDYNEHYRNLPFIGVYEQEQI